MIETVLDWRVRADDASHAARDIAFQAPDAVLARLADAIGVERVLSCAANLHVRSRGDMLLVKGRVHASVVQTCGVSLEPFETSIDEPIDVRFAANAEGDDTPGRHLADGEEGSPGMEDRPEPIVGGFVDLGALVQEFLALGVDPFPRKPEATLDPGLAEVAKESPFAALAKLRPKGLKDND